MAPGLVNTAHWSRGALPALLLLTLSSGWETVRGQEPSRQAFLERAEELILDNNYDGEETEHFRVQTDDPRFQVAAAGLLLESFRDYFEAFWSGHRQLREYDGPVRIFLFYSRFKYKQLLQPAGGLIGDVPPGHYRPFFDLIAVHTDTVGPADLPDVLVHEAAHQLIWQRLYEDRNFPTLWINEGLASYFGYTLRDKSARFEPGKIGGKQIDLLRMDESPGRGQRRSRLAEFRRALARGNVQPIDELIRITNPADFYGDGATDRYTASWTLLHFLLHGEDGSRASGLFDYLAKEFEGNRDPDELYRCIGMDADGLESAYREYVKELKAR